MNNKPITLLREDFMNNMIQLISDAGLPAFVIDSAMTELILQVRELSRQELERDKALYTQMTQEQNAQNEENASGVNE